MGNGRGGGSGGGSRGPSTNQGDPRAGAPAKSPAEMAITSDEVNFLVYRYLQESGMFHVACYFAKCTNIYGHAIHLGSNTFTCKS